MKISIVIPSFNVEETIVNVINELYKSKYTDEIIVIDNNSTDSTFKKAQSTNAEIVSCSEQGMGYAIKRGIKSTKNDVVIKIDGDIRNPNSYWINMLAETFLKERNFVSSYYSSDYDEFPVGNLLVTPLLKVLGANLSSLKMPLAGTYIFDKNYVNTKNLPGDWSFDLSLHIMASEKSDEIKQIFLGELNDKQKKIIDYKGMAEDLIVFLLNKYKYKQLI